MERHHVNVFFVLFHGWQPPDTDSASLEMRDHANQSVNIFYRINTCEHLRERCDTESITFFHIHRSEIKISHLLLNRTRRYILCDGELVNNCSELFFHLRS